MIVVFQNTGTSFSLCELSCDCCVPEYRNQFLILCLLFQEHAVDSKTRLMMYKLVNSGVLESVTGAISGGKEAQVFHAYGGEYVDLFSCNIIEISFSQIYEYVIFLKYYRDIFFSNQRVCYFLYIL